MVIHAYRHPPAPWHSLHLTSLAGLETERELERNLEAKGHAEVLVERLSLKVDSLEQRVATIPDLKTAAAVLSDQRDAALEEADTLRDALASAQTRCVHTIALEHVKPRPEFTNRVAIY